MIGRRLLMLFGVCPNGEECRFWRVRKRGGEVIVPTEFRGFRRFHQKKYVSSLCRPWDMDGHRYREPPLPLQPRQTQQPATTATTTGTGTTTQSSPQMRRKNQQRDRSGVFSPPAPSLCLITRPESAKRSRTGLASTPGRPSPTSASAPSSARRRTRPPQSQ